MLSHFSQDAFVSVVIPCILVCFLASIVRLEMEIIEIRLIFACDFVQKQFHDLIEESARLGIIIDINS